MNLTRREVVKTLASLPLVGAILGETGCDSIADTIDLAITAIGAAVDIAFPQYAPLLNPYFASAENFVEQYVAEMATGDSAAQKAIVIAADFAAIVAPNLSGVAAAVVEKVLAIAPLLEKLLAEVKALGALGGAASGVRKSYKPPTSAQLAKIRAKLADLKARIAAAH